MTELKDGTFVYSKNRGRGIVTYVNNNDVTVRFEGYNQNVIDIRSNLFAKGDRVVFNKYTHNPYPHFTDDLALFYEPILHNPKSKNKFTVMYNGSIRFAKTVEHFVEVKMEPEKIYCNKQYWLCGPRYEHDPYRGILDFDFSKCERRIANAADPKKKEMLKSIRSMELIAQTRMLKNAGFSLEDTISIIQGRDE